MSDRNVDLRVTEESLRSLERMVEQGDTEAANLALEMMSDGIESLADEAQTARLYEIRQQLADGLRAYSSSGP